MWKDFFYFSRRERQGILLLIVLIVGVCLGRLIFKPSKETPIVVVEQASPKDTTLVAYPVQQTTPRVFNSPERRNRPQPQQRTYYSPIEETRTVERPQQQPFPKQEKFTPGIVIELNAADSLDLKKIPGIGSGFAKRIISYKNILGGYHRIEQLQEVYGMYEELYAQIAPYLAVNSEEIVQIAINKSSLDKLRAHPYINFYQAKAIIEIRRKKGKIKNIEELKLLEEFTGKDWIRISPYLNFE
jgi:DNA uptake protein ComE-like DNA-binding protein